MEHVKIISNGKSIHMPEGKVYEEHPDMAKLLVEEMGVAVYANQEKQSQFEASKKKQVSETSKKKS